MAREAQPCTESKLVSLAAVVGSQVTSADDSTRRDSTAGAESGSSMLVRAVAPLAPRMRRHREAA